jgi:hypothetical protein
MTCRLQEIPKTIEGKDAVGNPTCRALGCECQFRDDPEKCPMAAAFAENAGDGR